VSHGESPFPDPLGESRPDDFLGSWKEIAAYLGRDVRTVQRWEKKEGLPVHLSLLKTRSPASSAMKKFRETHFARTCAEPSHS
jgi:hypothetical protein